MANTISSLQPVAERGWVRGFGNLLRQENHRRWGGRRWVRPALVWLVILNGFMFLVAYSTTDGGGVSPAESADAAAFMTIGTFATALGAVVAAQGVIIQEKQLGTAAWVLSKPASRSAFVLAKLVSHGLALMVLALALPAVAFYLQGRLLWGQTPPVLPFLLGWAVMALNVLFYVALMLMLGAVFNVRGPVVGLGLGFFFAGRLLPTFLPAGVIALLPGKLIDLAPQLAAGGPLPTGWPISVIASVLWTLLLISVALWRFEREEF